MTYQNIFYANTRLDLASVGFGSGSWLTWRLKQDGKAKGGM